MDALLLPAFPEGFLSKLGARKLRYFYPAPRVKVSTLILNTKY